MMHPMKILSTVLFFLEKKKTLNLQQDALWLYIQPVEHCCIVVIWIPSSFRTLSTHTDKQIISINGKQEEHTLKGGKKDREMFLYSLI